MLSATYTMASNDIHRRISSRKKQFIQQYMGLDTLSNVLLTLAIQEI